MDLGLRGRTALVTGASKGIGRAVAEGLAAEGCDLHLVARTAADLETAAARIGEAHDVTVVVHARDLSDSSVIPGLLEEAREVDILVNNAGAITGGDLVAVEEATWREGWELKVFGYINMTRAFYARMRERGSGVIINVTGLAGQKLDANYIAGSAGNASLDAFTRAAGAYSLEHGVRIVSVSPGAVATDRIVNLLRGKAEAELGDPERWQSYLANLPMSRAARPEEVANLVVFLASDRASYLSGAIYNVDGGHNARGGSFT
ncbi:MAG: short-chain dehydrogenase/reductase [Alphaproteobacteria bacterium]